MKAASASQTASRFLKIRYVTQLGSLRRAPISNLLWQTYLLFRNNGTIFCFGLLDESVYDTQEVSSGKHEKIQNI